MDYFQILFDFLSIWCTLNLKISQSHSCLVLREFAKYFQQPFPFVAFLKLQWISLFNQSLFPLVFKSNQKVQLNILSSFVVQIEIWIFWTDKLNYDIFCLCKLFLLRLNEKSFDAWWAKNIWPSQWIEFRTTRTRQKKFDEHF